MRGLEPPTSWATTRHSNQLSYIHHIYMVRQQGFEPGTYGLEVRCSIQLSYWRTVREKRVLVVTLHIFVKTKRQPPVSSDITRHPVVYVPPLLITFTLRVSCIKIRPRFRVEPGVQISGMGQLQGCNISYRSIEDIPIERALSARPVVRIEVGSL